MQVPDCLDPEVSVIVPCARDGERLVRCLRSLVERSTDVALEVVVVLNHAESGVRARLDADVTGVRVVESTVPLGFAGGVNLGAREARGISLCVLHDDAVVERGALRRLLDVLGDDPHVGAAGPLLLDLDGETVQSAGLVIDSSGRTRLPWPEAAPPAASDLGGVRAVDYCSAACVVVRGDVWQAIGGLDEEMHPGQFVDVSLAMAVRAVGRLVVCAPSARVRHARQGTGSSLQWRAAGERNHARFAARWAADLRAQAEPGDDPGFFGRARQATERRATELRGAEPRPLPPRSAPAPESETERLRREHAALRRDLAFKDACLAEHEQLAEHAEWQAAHIRALEERLARAENASLRRSPGA